VLPFKAFDVGVKPRMSDKKAAELRSAADSGANIGVGESSILSDDADAAILQQNIFSL
jgi:hypothetical protein